MCRQDLIARVGRLIGAQVESCQPVRGGYTPATRLLCRTASTSFFVKAGSTPLTCRFLRREIHVYTHIRGEFVPELVAWEDDECEPVLVIEDLSGHHWPPPWSERQIDLTLAQIEAMHHTKAAIEPFQEVHPGRVSGWRTVAEAPRPFLSLKMADGQWLGSRR